MDVNSKARELMIKYPNMVTAGEMLKELPSEKQRREVFARMIYFAQCDKNDEIFGRNLLED